MTVTLPVGWTRTSALSQTPARAPSEPQAWPVYRHDIHRSGATRSQVELLPLAVGSVPLGIAFADEKFSAEDLARFNELLTSFKASDDYSETLSKYGVTDYVKDWPLAQ